MQMILFDWTIILGMLGAYIVGTLYGFYFAVGKSQQAAIDDIDTSLKYLVAAGYIKSSTNKNGKVVLHKHWEEIPIDKD